MNPFALVGALGVKVSPEQQAQISEAVEQLPGILLRCKQLLATHTAQNGLLSKPVPPHDPLSLPERHVAGGGFSHDFTDTLGKPVTRGHIRNIGEHRVTVALTGMNGERSVFPLVPGQVEDTSSYVYRGLELLGDPSAEVLVSAQ